MKKKIIIIVLSFIGLLIIGGCVIYFNDELYFKLSYEYINFSEYNNGKKIEVSIPYDNRINYIKEEELLSLLDNGTGVIYFGYNTCPWCRNAVPVLIKTVKEMKLDSIYYVDTHKLDLASIKEELFSKMDNYLEKNSEGESVIAVPAVYTVKDGGIVGYHIGTVDDYYSPYQEMTDKQKEELANIYKEMIEEMQK